MSQHGGSSMMSSENPEVKYKKALKQISKLINANKVIRQQSEQLRRNMQNQMNQLAIRYNDVQKDHHQLQKEHQSLQKYLEQLQQRNTQLQRDHLTAEKQLAYLNQMLAEQNQQLKKVQAIKDQKKVAQLIRTYQQKEQLYLVERNSHEQLIKKLREEQNRLEFEVSQQRAMREETEDKFDLMRAEINQYRQINTILIQRNQKVYQQMYSKEGNTRQKQKEIQGLVQQFRRQISSLKTAKQSTTERLGAQYQSNYEMILEEKNKILGDYCQMKELYQAAQNKIKDMYDIQQRMKAALARNQTLNEQCNMLKSKIVVIESRQLMDEAGTEYQLNHKQFDDKVINLLSQGDPLIAIKNSDESSHFKILKAYIIELREKLEKVHAQRKQYTRKYKSISSKFTRVCDQSNRNQQQNKILRGKVQGFQKLTQKLQNQLQRNLVVHESQVTKMSTTASDLLTRKSQELQKSMKFMKQQIAIIQERSNKIQKNLRQQIESQSLQITTLSINKEELQQRLKQSNQFLTIYKKKLNELTEMHQQLQQKNSQLNESLIQITQLYKDQKMRNDNLSNQKIQLSTKISNSNEQIDKKVSSYEEQLRRKQQTFEAQLKKYQSDSQRLQLEIEALRRQNLINKRDYEERKDRDQSAIEQLKREIQYHQDIESRYNYEKNKSRQFQTQNQTLKIKNTKYAAEHQKLATLQDQLTRKGDQNNDLKRKIINLESALSVAESDLKQQKNEIQNLRKENSKFKIQLLQSGQSVRKQIDGKDHESRRIINNLNEQISALSLQLSQQKSRNSRLNSENHRYKNQKLRLEQFCEQLREKDVRNIDSINSLKGRVQSSIQELQRSKTQNRMLQLSVKRLNDEINNLQLSINNLRQQQIALKVREQQSESSKSEVIRSLESLKFLIQDVEQHVGRLKSQSNLSWEDQRSKDSLNELVSKLRRIMAGQTVDSRSHISGSNYAFYSNNYNYPAGNPHIHSGTSFNQVSSELNYDTANTQYSKISAQPVYNTNYTGTVNISSQPVYSAQQASNYQNIRMQTSNQQSAFVGLQDIIKKNTIQQNLIDTNIIQKTVTFEVPQKTQEQSMMATQNTRKVYTSDSMYFGQSKNQHTRYHQNSSQDYTPKNFFTTYADSSITDN